MTGWRERLIILAWLVPAACGKAVDSSGDVDASGQGGGDDGGDGGPADGGADGGSADRTGVVYAFAQNYTDAAGTGILHSTATAEFGDHATEDCTLDLPGADCQVLICTSREPAGPFPGAGTILIESPGVQPEAELTPGSDGAYAPVDIQDLLFSDGDRVSATARGDMVPAFDLDLDGPYHIGFQGGVPTSTAPVEVSASTDTELFWSSIEDTDTVRIRLSTARDGDGTRKLMECILPAGSERVSLTSTALGRLPQGALDFEARVETTITEVADDYEVTFTAAVIMRTGDDATFDRAAGTVNLVP